MHLIAITILQTDDNESLDSQEDGKDLEDFLQDEEEDEESTDDMEQPKKHAVQSIIFFIIFNQIKEWKASKKQQITGIVYIYVILN